MGFTYTKLGDSLGSIEFTTGGENVKEFTQCIQSALKDLSLYITVDVGETPQVLGEILPSLLKLRQILANHNGTVSLKGLHGKIPQEFLGRLEQFGFVIIGPRPSSNVLKDAVKEGITHGVVNMPDTSEEPLPTAEILIPRLLELKDRLTERLKSKKSLEQEQATYSDRLKILTKGLEGDSFGPEKIQQMQQLEIKKSAFSEKKTALVQKFEEMKKKLEDTQVTVKQKTEEKMSSHKKEKEALDKHLANLIKEKDKAVNDAKKKSDQRKSQITQLQAKKS